MEERSTNQLESGGSIPTSPLQTSIVKRIIYQEAKPFVEKHHYTHSIGIVECACGLFFNNLLVGVITFAHVSGRTTAKSILSDSTSKEVWELRRMVLLDSCPTNSESFFICRAVKIVKEHNSELRLLVAFADCNVGHTGHVYKASGWKEWGKTSPEWHYTTKDNVYVNKYIVWRRAKSFGKKEREQATLEGLTYHKDKPKNRFIRIIRNCNNRLVIKDKL
uniref:N-acetyltransferase domain-containing protein n=1 Tax=viral metagenome TaxID=1070528 RepID=A0A6M3K0B1_9ZZZZ